MRSSEIQTILHEVIARFVELVYTPLAVARSTLTVSTSMHVLGSIPMRLLPVVSVIALPFMVLACGGSPENPQGSTSSSSASSSSGNGGSAGSGGMGVGGMGAGGEGNTGGMGSGGAGGGSSAALDPTYIVELTLPQPTMIPGGDAVTVYLDVPYGTDPLQRLDIILPKGVTSAPLMINIHGGGFVGGDKSIMVNPSVQNTLAQGIAYASLNYRLLQDVDKEGVIKPMTDCKRALQFLRYHAAALNIDPTRVALKGGSAGAGTSLWIGLHDDMASDRDPVDKMTTRVRGIVANNTQATYDIGKWETVVFLEYGINLMDMVVALGNEQRLASFYGMDSIAQFDSAPILAYRADVDMLTLMTADDPPIYVHNAMATTAAPKDQNELFHHAKHARAVKDAGEAAGIPVTAVVEAYNIDESNGQNDFTFLIDKLKN
jgi:para-nitrobenzyl esterase